MTERATAELSAALAEATRLLKEGRVGEAAARADALAAEHPHAVDAWMLQCAVAQRRGDFDGMLAAAERAHAADPAHRGAEFRLLECRLYCGQADRVIERLRVLEKRGHDDAGLLGKVAEFYSHCTRHADAHRCYRRAVELAPGQPDLLFSFAASQIAVGQLREAEVTLDAVIELNPEDYDAYRNRATLRRRTAGDNHIDEMLAVLGRGVSRPAGEAQLCYALAKEYEDLGEDQQAFDYLERGARRRRSLMRYRVESDLVAMACIREVFSADLLQRPAAGCAEPGPIFVLGLPRSGTTLVDRILSSHSRVASLGEVNDLTYALMRTVGGGDKVELIKRAATADFAALGRRYVDSTRAYGLAADLLIDKTPLNYLYLGLIHLALPNARIVHLERQPMDACYGMFRTLFRAGYPFSYDLDDLARYYVAYRELMAHWRRSLPQQAFLDVSYEALVDDQEAVTRRLLEHCGLDWEPECLEFHRNAAPVATASSAQVRRPVYRDALERWRRYETRLVPLAEKLKAAGIDTGRAR